jgi:NAD(P) transhydrogenase subunit alpha
MNDGTLVALMLFALSLMLGVEVIGKVPATLHTPLMSATNAIHGVVFVGAVVMAASVAGPLGHVLLFVAAFLAATNLVGGYVVTDRMLAMFRPVRGGDRS